MSKGWTLAVALLLALPVLSFGAATLLTPRTASPSPTAYEAGGGNFTMARQTLAGAGVSVHAAVSSISLVPPGSLLIIPRPEGVWSARQTAALQSHLDAGGSAWIAGGHSLSPWLAEMGAAMGSQHLLQAGSATPAQVLLQATVGGSRHAVASSIPGTLLLKEGAGWIPWLVAPAEAHLDLDADGKVGQGDPPGPFPVGAALKLPSGGTLVATADDSLLSDALWSVPGPGNGEFLRAVVTELAPTAVAWDESGHGWTPRETAVTAPVSMLEAARALPAWAWLAAACAFVGLVVLLARPVQNIRAFMPHRSRDLEQHPARAPSDVLEVAWELLAEVTGRPLAELQAAGPDAARGLAEDAALRRVLLGQGSSQDRRHVLKAFTIAQEPPT